MPALNHETIEKYTQELKTSYAEAATLEGTADHLQIFKSRQAKSSSEGSTSFTRDELWKYIFVRDKGGDLFEAWAEKNYSEGLLDKLLSQATGFEVGPAASLSKDELVYNKVLLARELFVEWFLFDYIKNSGDNSLDKDKYRNWRSFSSQLEAFKDEPKFAHYLKLHILPKFLELLSQKDKIKLEEALNATVDFNKRKFSPVFS